ncbi:MAG TPA: alpha-D-ribose 1-methylphosphonate 5-triphosphate diphosphatase [Alphaproteobacteria bacterium]|nr:alpha-D-ribose 1-methylphosphonate 5-triphosphate diphosphatase [Alphaproteobacteria bacterium]
MTTETILTNARIVTRTEVFEGTVHVRDGAVASVDKGRSSVASAEDLDGDHLLPGLIELHTDNLEKHFMPRPGVLWPSSLSAMIAHDTQIVGAGITTVLDAICVGVYRDREHRRQLLKTSIEAVQETARLGVLRADHLLHLRCEVSDPGVIEMFEPFEDEPLLRLVSVMDHTPGQRQWSDLKHYRQFHHGLSEAELATRMAVLMEDSERYSARHRREIVERCRRRGLPLASHDDTTEEHVDEAIADGITISEFPTTLAAAEKARRSGMTTIMGAPNMVRGGSHSGNVSALDLASEGLLDGLSSDYVPSSLLHAAFLLEPQAGIPLPDAIATVSANAAAMVGLDDRGEIAPGKRADLLRVRKVGDLPTVRTVWREGQRVL